MFDTTRLPELPRRLLGRLEYLLLRCIGRLVDRSEVIYRLDVALSSRRRHRNRVLRASQDGADPNALRRFERSWRSQNGEDGALAEVLVRIGATNRHAIEVGASDGEENCTRHLVDSGWTAHWIEADAEKATTAAAVAPAAVTVIAEPAYRDTVVRQLREAGAQPEPDVLVVDIDGDDLGILCACLDGFRPRVVVVEYNAAFSPAAIWALRPEAADGWDGTFRHGASLGALDHVAGDAGYALVHCDSVGVNAFFVRSDLLAGRFASPGDLSRHFRVASFSPHPFGHPRSLRAVAPMQPLTVEDVAAVVLRDATVTPAQGSTDTLAVSVEVSNRSTRWLSSPQGPHAFNLGVRWLDGDADLPPDLPRVPLPRPLAPGVTMTIRLLVASPSESGAHTLRVTAVGEGVAWREHLPGPGAYCDATAHIEEQTTSAR